MCNRKCYKVHTNKQNNRFSVSIIIEELMVEGRKPGLVDRKLDSRSKGHGFESCLILH